MTFIVSQSTICRLRDRYRQHRSTRDLLRSGRPSVITAAQYIYIRVRHLRDHLTTATSTASFIPRCHRISNQTVRVSLREAGIRARRHFEPVASSKQTPMGLDASLMATTALFWISDEYRFMLRCADGRE